MLVGREPERRTISRLMAGARVGDSGVLVLSGEPGIGKTALLTEAEAFAGEMRVLRARGVESERVVPFAGLLQLLRPGLPYLEHLPAPQARALSAALLLDSSDDAETSRFAVGAATLSLLSRAAEDRPVAVLVDDAHLLDSPSTEALVFAARRLVSDAVAVLVAVRAGEPGAEAWASLPWLEVGGLDLEAAEQLVSGTSGPVRREQLVRLHRATAGNPLALLELGDRVRGVESLPAESPLPLPEQLSRSFLGRVEHLGEDARMALLVAAIDGASAATVFEACRLLGVERPSLSEAEDTGLLVVRDDRIEFRHPLVRSAVYGSAEAATRRSVHRALASVVPRGETDRLAWHLSESAVAPDEETAAVLDEVARDASARGADAIATLAHERAATLTGTATLLAGRLAAAGEAAWLAGQSQRAVVLLDRALTARPERALRAHIFEVRGAVETRCGSLDTALRTYQEAARDIEADDPDLAIRLLADSVHVAFYLAEPAAAMRAAGDIERLTGSAKDPGARYLGAVASGMALVLSGSGARGIERLREASYRLVEDEESGAERFRLPLRLQGQLWLRDSGPRRTLVNDVIEQLRAEAALGSLPYLLMHIARDGAASDRWQDAETAYLEAIRLARETGQTTDLAVSHAGLAVLDARRGQARACADNVAAAEEISRRNHIRLATFWLLFAQGDLAAGLGDLSTAADRYEELERLLGSLGLADPDQSCAPELVETYVHLGRPEDAREIASAFLPRAEAKGHPWSLARAERALALCATGDPPEPRFRRALELHAATPDRYEAARTELAFGAWLRRHRRRSDARPVLRSALETFEQLGAAPWADKAAQELHATGETVRRRTADAAEQLTPQERQIAQLLAHGRTTREAAAALFISPKTVEYHLRHVYIKLDISSRADLAARFS